MNTEQKRQQTVHPVAEQQGAVGGQAPASGQPPAYGNFENGQLPAYGNFENGQLPAHLQSVLGNGQLSGYVQTENHGFPPNVIVVTQPAPVTVQTSKPPQDYLTLSLFSIIFFWPMAICAIIYSCQSRTSAASGDYQRSMNEGRTARNLSIVAIVLAIVIVVATVVPIVVVTNNSRREYERYGY